MHTPTADQPARDRAQLAAAYDREWTTAATGQPYHAFWRWRPSARDTAEALLGPVAGRRVLELAAGAGVTTLRLARRGAAVIAVDLSRGGLRIVATRAAQLGQTAQITLLCADVQTLPLADHSVDLVTGENFLMYVESGALGAEAWRVLRPGGRAVFLEPTAHHPLIRLYRRFGSPYRGTAPHYFALTDLPRLAAPFASCTHQEFYLLAVLALPLSGRPFAFALAYRLLNALDQALFRLVPASRRLAWLTVIALETAPPTG